MWEAKEMKPAGSLPLLAMLFPFFSASTSTLSTAKQNKLMKKKLTKNFKQVAWGQLD